MDQSSLRESARGVGMPHEGMRRSSRIPREIAILLVGSDMEGKMFTEETKTVLLSRHGAGIVSEYPLYAEQELILRRLDSNKEAEIRIVGKIGTSGKVHTYGVAFVSPDLDLWGISFPKPTESEKKASRVMLQCSGCRKQEMVEQSEMESDVYLVNEGIVRTCKTCGSSTFWRRPLEAGPAEDAPQEAAAELENEVAVAVEPPPVAPPEPAAPPPPPRPENRRKHVRTKVSFKACIRSYTFGDDVVECEDMSRGGLRFRTRKPYTEKLDVEVAAPYSPGAHAIFVRAQIVHVVELKTERRYRCGLSFAKR
jgi:hypothetical protein